MRFISSPRASTRLEKYQFPFELNEVTREYFEREADIVGGQTGADMKAILQTPPDPAALARLSAIPYYNARDSHYLRCHASGWRPCQ